MSLWIPIVSVVIIAAINAGFFLCNENNFIFGRCCSFPGWLLITNRASTVGRSQRPQHYWVWDLLDPLHQYTACFGGYPLLTIYRAACVAVFIFTSIWAQVAETGSDVGGEYFLWFTNWTYTLFGASGAVGVVLTTLAWATAVRRGAQLPPLVTAGSAAALGKSGGAARTPLGLVVMPSGARAWRWWHKLYLLLQQIVCAASILVTLFFWIGLYHGGLIQLSGPMKHGVSSVLMLGDLALSRTPVVSYHLQACMMYGTVYLIFLWVRFGVTGRWVYGPFDWSTPTAPLYYLSLLVLLLISYTLMLLVAGLRELALTRACFLRCGSCCGSCCAPDDGDEEAGVGGGGGPLAQVVARKAPQLQTATRQPGS